jgi:hypothetical protein
MCFVLNQMCSLGEGWAPLCCKFFLWLVILKRCWTADRLAKQDLPHPSSCPHCDQEQETTQYLLLSQVRARQIWFILLQQVGLQAMTPQPGVVSFSS